MSRLQLHGRQWVVFDAKNKDHRRWFADFNETGAWGRCPVRFVVNDDHGDLITQIQRELIAHYVGKEFLNPGNKSSKLDNKSKKRYNNTIAKQ
jgi:hypothetical protein